MLLRRSGVRLGHQLGPRKVHRVRRREATAIESFPAHVPDTETGEDVQADARAAYQIATTEVEAAAEKAWALEKRTLYRNHRDALKAVEEWRVSLGLMNERERQRTQRGRLMAAIQEVQECATSRRRDTNGAGRQRTGRIRGG
jgi:hypothetical protein